MTKVLLISSLIALGAIGAAISTEARDYPKKPYDAMYTTTGPTGSSTMRLACDGKGHVMSETQNGPMRIISIYDYPANLFSIVRPEQRRVTKMPMTDEQASQFDENATVTQKGKPLGSKVISGHPCKGWLFTPSEGMQMENWLADDIRLSVKRIVTTKMGTSTTVLSSYSASAPPDSAFVVPAY